MSTTKKRATTPKLPHNPRPPGSASSSRSASNLNSTVRAPGSSSRFSIMSRELSDITMIGNGRAASKSLKFGAVADPELEMDLVYNNYLIALAKRELVKDTIKKYEQDMKDQIAIQKDNLHESQMKLKEERKRIASLEQLQKVDKLLTNLEKNVNQFLEIIAHGGLQNALEALCSEFEKHSNKVVVSDIQPIATQEGIDQLVQLLEECASILVKMKSRRPLQSFEELGLVIRKYEDLKKMVGEKQTSLQHLQKSETFKLLKTLSDMYAQREKDEKSD